MRESAWDLSSALAAREEAFRELWHVVPGAPSGRAGAPSVSLTLSFAVNPPFLLERVHHKRSLRVSPYHSTFCAAPEKGSLGGRNFDSTFFHLSRVLFFSMRSRKERH